MKDDVEDILELDEIVAIALAESVVGEMPGAHVKQRLFSSLGLTTAPPVPQGFDVRSAVEGDWVPHPVPGIGMKVLSINRACGYATLLLDVAPGTRFPAHHHSGDEECFVISGSVFSLGRRLGAGDFLHADAGTDHGELWTEEGATVLLVVPPEDYMPDPGRP